MGKPECFLCGNEIRRQLGFNPAAYTKQNQKILQSLRKSWTNSLCILMDVTASKSQKLLETVPYCLACHELLSSVEFMINTITRMQGKLGEVREEIKELVTNSSRTTSRRRRKVLGEIFDINNCREQYRDDEPVEMKYDPKTNNDNLEMDNGAIDPDFCDFPADVESDEAQIKLELVEAELGVDDDDPVWIPNEKVRRSAAKNFNRNKSKSASSSLNRRERLTCQVCRTVIYGKRELQRHKRNEHPQDFSITCEICQKVMFGKRDLARHIKNVHNSSDEKFPHKCKVCGKGFSTTDEVTQHELLHEVNTENPFSCVLCPAELITMYDLQCHVIANHDDQRIIYQCDQYQCSVICSTAERLRVHRRLQHLIGVTQMHYCPHCPFQAVYASILRTHIKGHGERLFKCDFEGCGKSFFRKNTMNLHKNRVHGLGTKPLHPCLLCPKKYYSASLLKAHQVHHSNHRPYMCELCSATFKTQRNLANHGKVHDKNKTSATNLQLQKPRRGRLQSVIQIENLLSNQNELTKTVVEDVLSSIAPDFQEGEQLSANS